MGSTKQKMRSAALDIAIDVISGNLVAYFIIISTASTLFVHHQNITTAADAARSLEPLLGPLAKYLFAVGLIGAGLVAIPVLLAVPLMRWQEHSAGRQVSRRNPGRMKDFT